MTKRPYDDVKNNMEYKAAENVLYEDGVLKGGKRVELGFVALIQLNSTFAGVKEFATVLDLDPIQQESELLNCHTVGFGLIGRTESTTPADELLMPMEYIILKSKLDFQKCTVK